MTFDPYAPYGPLVDTTLRVVVWNVWGRYGAWEQRQAGLEDVLAAVEPDIACPVESRATPEATQADRVGDRLGLEHRVFVGDSGQGGWTSGTPRIANCSAPRRHPSTPSSRTTTASSPTCATEPIPQVLA